MAKPNKGKDYTGIQILETLENAKNYNNFLIKLVIKTMSYSKSKSKNVLDFGAGTGLYADLLKNQHSISVTCFEPDTKLKKIISEKSLKQIDNTNNLSSFQTIYSLNVFEHIEDDQQVLDDLYKNTKKKTSILIYVPAFPLLYTSMDKKVQHFRRYKKNQLVTMTKESGFTVIESKYVDPLGFFAAIIYKLLDRGNGNISQNGIFLFDRIIFPLNRILHPITSKFFGKNVYVIAKKN